MLYTQIKDPGLGDKIAYYNVKRKAYYESLNWDFSKMNPEVALPFTDTVLQLIEKNDVQKLYLNEYIEANFAKGDILYYMMNKHVQALAYFFKGKTLSDQLTDDCDKAAFSSRFALINYKEGKFRQAAALFKQQYRQQSACKLDFDSFAAIQGSIDNTGLCYMELGMSDSAIFYLNKTISYVDDHAKLFPAAKTIYYGCAWSSQRLHWNVILVIKAIAKKQRGFIKKV